MCFDIVVNMFPTANSGGHVANAIRPPDLVTRGDKSEERRRIDAYFEKLIEPGVLPEIEPDNEIG